MRDDLRVAEVVLLAESVHVRLRGAERAQGGDRLCVGDSLQAVREARRLFVATPPAAGHRRVGPRRAIRLRALPAPLSTPPKPSVCANNANKFYRRGSRSAASVGVGRYGTNRAPSRRRARDA